MNKIKNFISTRTTQDWVVIGTWLTTLGLLFGVIGTLAAPASSNTQAAVALVMGIFLMGSVLITATFSYLNKKRGN